MQGGQAPRESSGTERVSTSCVQGYRAGKRFVSLGVQGGQEPHEFRGIGWASTTLAQGYRVGKHHLSLGVQGGHAPLESLGRQSGKDFIVELLLYQKYLPCFSLF